MEYHLSVFRVMLEVWRYSIFRFATGSSASGYVAKIQSNVTHSDEKLKHEFQVNITNTLVVLRILCRDKYSRRQIENTAPKEWLNWKPRSNEITIKLFCVRRRRSKTSIIRFAKLSLVANQNNLSNCICNLSDYFLHWNSAGIPDYTFQKLQNQFSAEYTYHFMP